MDPGIPVFGTKGASVHVQEIVRSWRAGRRHNDPLHPDRAREDLADVRVLVHPIPKGTGPARARAHADATASLAEQAIAWFRDTASHLGIDDGAFGGRR